MTRLNDRRAPGRRLAVRLALLLEGGEEVIAVSDRLDHDEQRVERERRGSGEHELSGRELGPGALVVNVGRTRLSVVSVSTVTSAVAVPSALNEATCRRSAATRTLTGDHPVARDHPRRRRCRARAWRVSESPEAINVTISPTSINVTASARMSAPNGSPTRCAITSAWCTAASTAPARIAPTITRVAGPACCPRSRRGPPPRPRRTTTVHRIDAATLRPTFIARPTAQLDIFLYWNIMFRHGPSSDDGRRVQCGGRAPPAADPRRPRGRRAAGERPRSHARAGPAAGVEAPARAPRSGGGRRARGTDGNGCTGSTARRSSPSTIG